MAVVANRFYNNPALGAAFGNLAAAFAPPSGSDLAGYATAAAKKQEAARLAQLFENTDLPDWDRRAIAADLYDPSQSFYSVDEGNAVARRGQDIDAQTSRLNNANTVRGGAIGDLFGPLNEGQVRPALPAEIGATIGLPAVGAVAGNPKPLSETEWNAQQNQRLLEAGALTDDMLLDTIVGAETPVEAVGPEGAPIFMSPGAAVRSGAEAYVNPGSQAAFKDGVALIDGRQVPVTRAPNERMWRTQDGTPIPETAQVFDTPKPTGTNEQLGLPTPTTANMTQANSQEAEVSRAIQLLNTYEQTIRGNPGALGVVGAIRGTAQNLAASANDLAAAFGTTAPDAVSMAENIRNGLSGVAPELFDPSIPEVQFMQGTLAYTLARTENPSGEVSRQAYDRALERIRGGGLLANSQSALAAVSALRTTLNSQLEGIRTLRNPGTGETDTSYRPPDAPQPGDVVEGYIFRGGDPADPASWEPMQ